MFESCCFRTLCLFCCRRKSMIFRERSPLSRLVVLIVFYTAKISATFADKFRLDEGSGYLWFLYLQRSSRTYCIFEGMSRLFRYHSRFHRGFQKHLCSAVITSVSTGRKDQIIPNTYEYSFLSPLHSIFVITMYRQS